MHSENHQGLILIIDSSPDEGRSICTLLQQNGYTVAAAESVGNGVATLENEDVSLVITDFHSARSEEQDIVLQIKQNYPTTETLLLTDYESIESTAPAIRTGADGSIVRPVSEQRLLLQVEKTLERRKMRLELTALRQHVAMNYGFDNIVGISQAIAQLKDTARRIAPTDITTLISGAPGTGKELLARTIHHHSERRTARFVTIDCSTIPEPHLESRLFGQQGIGPDKSSLQQGLFDEAHGGTAYLDQVDALPASAQARLLQFLQNSEVSPVGAPRPHRVDVRIIASAEKDLNDLVNSGSFREDLYYRLNVIPLVIPPLAKRAEDIEMLVEYFLRQISAEMKKPNLTITREAVDRLVGHNWPGNVRELENTLKRGAALCTSSRLDVQDILFIGGESTTSTVTGPTSTTITLKPGLLDNSQRTLIIKALNNNGWNYTRTAAELGIGRTTLWRKIKKYSLKHDMAEQS